MGAPVLSYLTGQAQGRRCAKTALSGNSPALKANPEISTISETCGRASWQGITESQEHIRAFVTLMTGNKQKEFKELQSHTIVLSLGAVEFELCAHRLLFVKEFLWQVLLISTQGKGGSG